MQGTQHVTQKFNFERPSRKCLFVYPNVLRIQVWWPAGQLVLCVSPVSRDRPVFVSLSEVFLLKSLLTRSWLVLKQHMLDWSCRSFRLAKWGFDPAKRLEHPNSLAAKLARSPGRRGERLLVFIHANIACCWIKLHGGPYQDVTVKKQFICFASLSYKRVRACCALLDFSCNVSFLMWLFLFASVAMKIGFQP